MAAINPHGPAIGDRPTVLMAYLEYPKYVPPTTVCHRDEDGVDHMFPWAKDVNEERARVDERNRTGWASDGRHAYVPLGNPEDFPYDALEIRERLTKATAKPKIVLPKRERKRSKSGGLSAAEDDETSAERLFVDTPVQGSVKQFCYQYYRFDLKQPKKNLVLKLTAVDGDPDLFVSNELETPKQDPNEHIWRGAAAGDDELLISIDHPRYALGTYWIGVYSVRDSHFELTAHLKEPPTEIVMDFNERKLGNGYAPLAQLVSKSDSRRKACKFDIAGRSERPTPNDPLSLFKTLPEHLQKELTPNLKKSAVAAADGNKSGGSSSKSPAKPGAGGGAAGGASSSSSAGASKDGVDAKGTKPLSILTNSYLSDACFGAALAPLRYDQIAVQPGAIAAADAASRPTDLLPIPPSASPSSPVVHPWLPSEREPSHQAFIERQVGLTRANDHTELKTHVMHVRHSSLKADLDEQMRRIANGMEAERDLIVHFKAKAMEKAILQDKDGPPLVGSTVEILKSIRQQADAMRQDTLKELAVVAEKEAQKAAAAAGVEKKKTWKSGLLKLKAMAAFTEGGLRRSQLSDGGGGGGRRGSVRRGSVRNRDSTESVGSDSRRRSTINNPNLAGMSTAEAQAEIAKQQRARRSSNLATGGGGGTPELQRPPPSMLDQIAGVAGGAKEAGRRSSIRAVSKESMSGSNDSSFNNRRTSTKFAEGTAGGGGLPNIFGDVRGAAAGAAASEEPRSMAAILSARRAERAAAEAAAARESEPQAANEPRRKSVRLSGDSMALKGRRPSKEDVVPSVSYPVSVLPKVSARSQSMQQPLPVQPPHDAEPPTSARSAPSPRAPTEPSPRGSSNGGPRTSRLSKKNKAPVKRVAGVRPDENKGGPTLDAALLGIVP